MSISLSYTINKLNKFEYIFYIHIFEYILNIFAFLMATLQTGVSVKRAALKLQTRLEKRDRSGKQVTKKEFLALHYFPWICSGVGGIIRATWSGCSCFATECYCVTEVLCWTIANVEQSEVYFLHTIFKDLSCQIKGRLNSSPRLYLKENVSQATHQLQGKHILEEQLIMYCFRTQCSWCSLNQKKQHLSGAECFSYTF